MFLSEQKKLITIVSSGNCSAKENRSTKRLDDVNQRGFKGFVVFCLPASMSQIPFTSQNLWCYFFCPIYPFRFTSFSWLIQSDSPLLFVAQSRMVWDMITRQGFAGNTSFHGQTAMVFSMTKNQPLIGDFRNFWEQKNTDEVLYFVCEIQSK